MQHSTTEEAGANQLILDGVDIHPLYSQEYVSALRADSAKWFEAFEKVVAVGARHEERIAELESDLSEWTDCKHDGAIWYDFSGHERCGKCGADV